MPVYEYRCNDCGREFEYQQRMSDPDKTGCEACGKETLERIISRTAFALKGSGWYKDLYSSSKPEAGTKAGDAKPAAGGDKAATPSSTDSSSSPASTPASTPASASPSSGSASSGSASSGSASSGSTSSGGSSSGGGAASSS